MDPRLLVYTMKVKCFDGVVRSFERQAYFTGADVLRRQLSWWNGQPGPAGEPYQYFETIQQAFQNDTACRVSFRSLPDGTLVWEGPYQHNYTIARSN